MAKVTLINGDAADYNCESDLILTDPPYELDGATLAQILARYPAKHLVLITTMRQLMALMQYSDWVLNFDFVLDGVAPKKSKSLSQPNYTHQTGVYLTRGGVKSAFNRKLRQRSDVFEGNGYWPTLFHAPRNAMQDHGHAKNEQAITDLLGSFALETVVDPFAGTGSTGMAALELQKPCVLIEKDAVTFAALRKAFAFVGTTVVCL